MPRSSRKYEYELLHLTIKEDRDESREARLYRHIRESTAQGQRLVGFQINEKEEMVTLVVEEEIK